MHSAMEDGLGSANRYSHMRLVASQHAVILAQRAVAKTNPGSSGAPPPIGARYVLRASARTAARGAALPGMGEGSAVASARRAATRGAATWGAAARGAAARSAACVAALACGFTALTPSTRPSLRARGTAARGIVPATLGIAARKRNECDCASNSRPIRMIIFCLPKCVVWQRNSH